MNTSKKDARLCHQVGVGLTQTLTMQRISQRIPRASNHSLELPSSKLLFQHAQQYAARGFSVFPVTFKEDGQFKKPAVKWKHFQQRRPTPEELRSMFERPNLTGLAAVLGPASGDLYCRDFDSASAHQRWAEAHPEFAKLLPSVLAARGPHVYFHSTQELYTQEFDDGELRGLGGYAIMPPSIHHTGHVYEWRIPLPLGKLPTVNPTASGLCQDWSCTESTERTELYRGNLEHRAVREDRAPIENTATTSVHSVISVLGALDESEIVALATPTKKGQNHRRLFALARGVRGLEKQRGGELSLSELQRIFGAWYEQAEPFLSDEQSRDEYLFEFLDGLSRVKYPLGEEVLTLAWLRAQKPPRPKAAEQFEHPKIKLLVALCRELQRAAGLGAFFLASRTVARLFHHDTHTTAALWLRGLVHSKVISEVEKGGPTTNKASRYKYLHPLDH